MPSEELKQYIEKSRQAGKTDDQIRQELLGAGWKVADFEMALGTEDKLVDMKLPDISLKLEESPADVGIGQISSPLSIKGNTDDLELRGLKNKLQDIEARLIKLESLQQKQEYFPLTGVQVPPEFRKDILIEGTKPKETILAKPQENVESKITGKSFAFLGVLAILFGVSFFLKYAFDNDLISVAGRIMLGVLTGSAFLLLGDFLSRKDKYKQYSFYLSGGGLALLYLSIYAAFNFYDLIGQTPAFLAMIMVTAGGALLSLRANAKALAGLALLGGFMTPFLVSTGPGSQITLFFYVFILDIGFLSISYFKKWRELFVISIFGSYIIFGVWFAAAYQKELLISTLGFLTLFFIIFIASSLLSSVSGVSKNNRDDIALGAINAAAYFPAAYYILDGGGYNANFIGLFFIFWSAVYIILALSVRKINKDDYYGFYGFVGLGLVLATIAVPIFLDKNWITIAWSAESLILAWIGFKLKSQEIRSFGLWVAFITAIRLIFIDNWQSVEDSFTPFFNERFFTYCAGVASFMVTAYLYRFFDGELKKTEKSTSAFMGLMGNFFLVSIISLDLWKSFEGNSNSQNLAISIFWAIYSGCLMSFGIATHSKSARLLSIFGFGIVIIKVFLYDSSALSEISRIVSFIFLGVILLVISFLSYRYKDKIKEFIMT